MKNTALITGATSGIGLELARIHASKGRDLFIVARREEELKKIKEEFESNYNIEVDYFAADLMTADGPKNIFEYAQKKGMEIEYLMNNAGLGGYGLFHERPVQKELDMIRLNVQSLVELTHLFLPAMIERKKGKILNTSSTAGFVPGPLQVNYYATKAYVNSFSSGLDQEVRRLGITVTALCPGPVKSGFWKVAGMEKSSFLKNAASAQKTALIGYNAMEKGKLYIVSHLGFRYAVWFLLPILPLRFVLNIIEKLQRVN